MRSAATLPRSIARNRKGRPDQPRFLTYLVTFRCNAKCIMCDCWKKPPGNDLGLHEIDRILDELPRMDAVRLSGGEPFLRRDLPEIAARIQRKLKPRFLHITSNGLAMDRILDFCRERPRGVPLRLLISLDGLQPVHDRIRGISGAWEKAVATLRELAPRRREWRIDLSINQTIVDEEGIDQHRRLNRLFGPLGIPVHAVLAYDASATYSCQDEVIEMPGIEGGFTTFGEFSRDQLTELFREVESGLRRQPFLHRRIKRYYWNGVRSRLLSRTARPNPPCVALSSHMRILPDGRVPVCQFNSRSVGSLREQSFSDIWHGPEAVRQRRWVNACPGCWAECEVLPNAVYSGDLFSRLPFMRPLVESASSRTPGAAADPA